MKRWLILTGLGTTLLASALILPPGDATAGCIACLPYGETASHLGGGSTCAEAEENAIDAAMAEVPQWACDTQPVEVTECYPTSGGWLPFFAEWKVRYSRPENVCV